MRLVQATALSVSLYQRTAIFIIEDFLVLNWNSRRIWAEEFLLLICLLVVNIVDVLVVI